jgi:putative NAD(P)-binding protein
MLTTDYLIIGSGALGMTFADQLLTETDADMAIVDRHHMPGGHWNDAYSFVRLHQPSAFYGVGSRPLGSNRIDESGFNKGYYELASGAEVSSYFERVMQERFLPSGRVHYFPMCDYLGGGQFRSCLSRTVHEIAFRKKLVDSTYFNTTVPSTHTPSFEIAEGVRLVTPNALPKAAPEHENYVILGGGKTAMDVGVWLLQMGARSEQIRWILPRDSWLINRDTTQPGEAFFQRSAGGQAHQFEAAAIATSVADLFERLEGVGQLLRIDQTVRPTMYRGATISMCEVEMLRTIKDVVRKGHVRRIERNTILLEHATVKSPPDALYVDCTAPGPLAHGPPVPVFNGDRITIQVVRAGLTCFSSAVIAHVEAAYDDEAERNDLCAPMLVASSDLDWLRLTLADLRSGRRWGADKALRRWVSEHRLSGSGAGAADAGAHSLEAQHIRERLREARPRAEVNLARILAELA